MKYIVKIVLISEVDAFLEKFESDGDYEDYEIVNTSLYAGSVLFLLKEVSE